jgi:putative hemolysin
MPLTDILPSSPSIFPELPYHRPEFLERFLQLDGLQELRARASRDSAGDSMFDKVLRHLNLRYQCSDSDIARIPRVGPVVVVANHPSGLADGLVLGSLLGRIRPDVKVLANSLLLALDELRDSFIPVDPSGSRGAVHANWKALRRALEWLNGGGLLVVFPAGEVSALKLSEGKVSEPQWNDAVARLVKRTAAAAVPVFVNAVNSPAFQMLGLVHAALRTAMLPRELLNKRGKTIGVAVGGPIAAEALAGRTSREAVDYLRWRTELLGDRARGLASKDRAWFQPRPKRNTEISLPQDRERCRAEVNNLPHHQRLVEHGDFVVCYAHASQIPGTLREIGRCREIAFRLAGEGTGKASDIDVFDSHYMHLWVWDAAKNQVAGAYRFARTDEVLRRYGTQGLYTATLFRFKRRFLDYLDPAIELGRSFVHPDYQKSFWPLLLLWKGIGSYVARHPRYRMLFGPVSISDAYGPLSRAVMVAFLKTHHALAALAPAALPKTRFQARPVSSLAHDVDELSETISDLESDGKGVPVLLRQYLKLGGRMVEFNVDGSFSNALDGLIVVDLLRTNPRILERYLGKSGAVDFVKYHAGASNSPVPGEG